MQVHASTSLSAFQTLLRRGTPVISRIIIVECGGVGHSLFEARIHVRLFRCIVLAVQGWLAKSSFEIDAARKLDILCISEAGSSSAFKFQFSNDMLPSSLRNAVSITNAIRCPRMLCLILTASEAGYKAFRCQD